MKTESRLMSRIGLGVAMVAMAATATALAGEGKKKAELGEPVPGFTLVDSSGQKRSLSDYEGRIVVLEWINTECPYVVNCYKTKAMQTAYEKINAMDKTAVWLAINTTFSTGPNQNEMWIKQYKLDYPILLDTDGTVGKLFDARRTPHMFVIDKEGILRYHGAIDANKMGGTSSDEATSYVVNAVEQIIAGETVAPDYIKPYGCSVKYAK